LGQIVHILTSSNAT